MALLEAGLYTVLLCLSMLVVYVFPLLLSGKLLDKAIDFLVRVCFGGEINKEPLKSDDLETWPMSWWTDEKHFALEQEVVFRKVRGTEESRTRYLLTKRM